MKPARGSARSSKQGPKEGGGKRKQPQQRLTNTGSLQDKTKKTGVPAVARKVKGQDKWKPLAKSSVSALEDMLGLSILSVLSLRKKDKEEVQKHLNLLKDQFVVKCVQLPVPPQKNGNVLQASRLFQAESQKIKHGEKKIEALEESSRAVVSRLEQLQEKLDFLEHNCKIMRDKLEEEEENARQFLQLAERSVLHLPALPAQPEDEPTLQEKMMKMVPNPKAVTKALQNSKVTGNVKSFLELAHKQADQMLTHALSAGSENEIL